MNPVLVLPDEPLPVRFMNTIWADTGGIHDVLDSPAMLRAWMTAAAVCADDDLPDPTNDEFADALLLRDALRRLAALRTEDSRAAAQSPIDLEPAVGAINTAVAALPRPHLVLHDGRLETEQLANDSAMRIGLASIAAAALDILTGPTSTRLRACYAPGCVLYFVKAHPRRQWCSDACGNRVRAARHYQRSRAGRD